MADSKNEINDEAQELRRLYRWSFAIRFGFGITAWGIGTLLNLPLMADANRYQRMGEMLAQDWISGSSSGVQDILDAGAGRYGLAYLIAVFYFLTRGVGSIPLLLAFYSAITAWTPVITYRIARQLEATPAAALTAARLVLFSPIFAFWSALYKEGMIFMLQNLIVYHVLRLQEKWQLRSLVIILVSLPALFALRFYLAIIIIMFLGVGLLLGRPKQEGRVNRPTTLHVLMGQAVIVFILGFVLVQMGFTDQAQELGQGYLEDPFAELQTMRNNLSRVADSGYLPDANVATPEAALTFLPLGLMYFLTGPLPWQTGGLLQNLAIPETTFWLLLYPFILSGMKQGLRRNFQGSVVLIVMSIAIACFFSLLTGNFGIAYRMRSQVWLLWAVFAGWGWESRRQKNRTALSPQRSRKIR